MTCSWFCLFISLWFFCGFFVWKKKEMKNLNSLHIHGFENYESLMVPKNIPNCFFYFLYSGVSFFAKWSYCRWHHAVSYHSIRIHSTSFRQFFVYVMYIWPPSTVEKKCYFRLFPGYCIHKIKFTGILMCNKRCSVCNIFPARRKNVNRICFTSFAIENSLKVSTRNLHSKCNFSDLLPFNFHCHYPLPSLGSTYDWKLKAWFL